MYMHLLRLQQSITPYFFEAVRNDSHLAVAWTKDLAVGSQARELQPVQIDPVARKEEMPPYLPGLAACEGCSADPELAVDECHDMFFERGRRGCR